MINLFTHGVQVLTEMTAVLLASIALHQITRSPVVRYAILLWTLIAVAICPLVAVMIPLFRLPPLGPSISISGALSPALVAFHPKSAPDQASDLNLLPGALLCFWAAGSLLTLIRLGVSLLDVQRLRRTALPCDPNKFSDIAQILKQRFGQKLPNILLSEHAAVPMAIGYWRPVVLIPTLLPEQIDRHQLSHVLIHECAHAARRDTLVGLLQRLLSAALWFHPLLHLVNRMLDPIREQICDNYVLGIDNAREYSQTLLAVAQLLPLRAEERLSPSLSSTWSLEDRVSGLLNSKRCVKTKLNPRRSIAIAATFIGGTLLFSCLAGGTEPKTTTQAEFSHVVRVNKTYSQNGDRITVEQVRGPADTWIVGNTYEVSGTYKLTSRDEANLAANVTIHSLPDLHPSASPGQTTVVSKGEGRFLLRFHMYQQGDPHVSFYPTGHGGNSFGGVYF